MLTTIHEINGNKNKIEKVWRRSWETNTNATKVCVVFENASKKSLSIPCVINNYHHFMDGVDIAN